MPEWNSCFGPACCDIVTGVWLCLCEENILIDIQPGESTTVTTIESCVLCPDDQTFSRVRAMVDRGVGVFENDYTITLDLIDCP